MIVWHCCHILLILLALSSSTLCLFESPGISPPAGAGRFLLTLPCFDGAPFAPALYSWGRRFLSAWICSLTISDSLSSLAFLSCLSCLPLGSLNSEEEIIVKAGWSGRAEF